MGEIRPLMASFRFADEQGRPVLAVCHAVGKAYQWAVEVNSWRLGCIAQHVFSGIDDEHYTMFMNITTAVKVANHLQKAYENRGFAL